MSPFKRLTDAGGQDPWLEATAEKVRAGDPWAAVSPQRAASVGAAALERVRDERLPRARPRRLVLVVAVLASSFALAAIGRQVVQQWTQEVPTPVVPVLAPVPAAPAPKPEPVAVPEAAPEPTPPSPLVGGRSTPLRSAEEPGVRGPLKAPKKVPPAETVAAPVAALDPLDAEAKLLLTALRQLKIERNPEAALATLDEHAARFPNGAMKDEAAAARREAEEGKATTQP